MNVKNRLKNVSFAMNAVKRLFFSVDCGECCQKEFTAKNRKSYKNTSTRADTEKSQMLNHSIYFWINLSKLMILCFAPWFKSFL